MNTFFQDYEDRNLRDVECTYLVYTIYSILIIPCSILSGCSIVLYNKAHFDHGLLISKLQYSQWIWILSVPNTFDILKKGHIRGDALRIGHFFTIHGLMCTSAIISKGLWNW